jgi:hypothetical protein
LGDKKLVTAYYPVTYKSAIRHPRILLEFASGGRKKVKKYIESQEREMVKLSSPESEDSINWHLKNNSTVLAESLHVQVDLVRRFYEEYTDDLDFRNCIRRSFEELQWRDTGHMKAAVNLYPLIRLAKPEVVIETGIGNGLSSSIVLRALQKNGFGTLYSIDTGKGPEILKPRKLGWMVPDDIRAKWKILLGTSRDLLPSLIDKMGKINIFIHDSDHSYENMTFELEHVWPLIVQRGAIVVDDVDNRVSQKAFDQFCFRNHIRPSYLETQYHNWRTGLVVRGGG